MSSPIRLVGIDLDGTLLNPAGRIDPQDAAAVRRAMEAGITVVPCTGRAWHEARHVLRQPPMDELALGIFVTGACVRDIRTGASHDIAVIEPHLAQEIVQHLSPLPEAVLVLREHPLAGHDYLVTGRGELSANTRWWFEHTGADVVHRPDVTLADLRHCLRVGVVASRDRVGRIEADLAAAFGEAISLHSFEALTSPDPAESVHIVEVFARGVDKWRGLRWLCDRHGIKPEQVACIGDEVNDVAMVARAGCGIAMGNAIEPVKKAARFVTHGHNQAGVAHALQQVISGRWR